MGELERPFIGTEARAAGRVSRRALRRDYDMLYRNVYAPKDFEMTAAARAVAAWLWSGRTATVAGLSAAALHGSRWVDADAPAELIRAEAARADGIVVLRAMLDEDEVCRVDGISTSTPARTAFDLGRRGQVVRAVVNVDALARATNLKPTDVPRWFWPEFWMRCGRRAGPTIATSVSTLALRCSTCGECGVEARRSAADVTQVHTRGDVRIVTSRSRRG